MHRFGDFAPANNLLGGMDARRADIADALWADLGRFGDNQSGTNALLLLGDRSATGACLSPGAKEEGYITRLPGAVSTALSLSVVISASLNTAESIVGNNTAGALGQRVAKCRVNRKGTSPTHHQQV
jgi:hypothetical protein